MTLVLTAEARARLRRDLLKQRQATALTDAEFVSTVLKISLNTYKKCVQPEDDAPLRLKRQTFINLFTHAGLSPHAYGLDLQLPENALRFGGYDIDDFAFLAGHYVQYRRSFLTGLSFNRSALEVRPNRQLGCFSFEERISYVSDRGVSQRTDYAGDIYIHQDRRLMTLLSIDHGEVRSVLVHLPSRPMNGRARQPFRLRGLQLTHAFPKGIYQPTVSPVLIEEAPGPAKPVGGTLGPDDAEYARIAAQMEHTEENAAVITSLLARAAP